MCSCDGEQSAEKHRDWQRPGEKSLPYAGDSKAGTNGWDHWLLRWLPVCQAASVLFQTSLVQGTNQNSHFP